jgi:hypothetical protein
VDRITERIAHMSRDEKYEELRTYLVTSRLMNLDVDRVKADQAIVGAPDSALDAALVRCSILAGSVLGKDPMTGPEFLEALKGQRAAVRQWAGRQKPIGMGEPLEPLISLRRSR